MKKLAILFLFVMSALSISGQSLEKKVLNNIIQIIENKFDKGNDDYNLKDYYPSLLTKRMPLENFRTKRNDILYVQIEAAYATDYKIRVTTWTKSGLYKSVKIDGHNSKVISKSGEEVRKFLLDQKYLKGKDRDFMPVPELIYYSETGSGPIAYDVHFYIFNIKYTIRNNKIVDKKVFITNYKPFKKK